MADQRTIAPERHRAKRPQMTVAPAAYSPKMFWEAYGIGHSKFYEEIKAGRLIARKVGNRTIILAADAESWAKSLPRLKSGERGGLMAQRDYRTRIVKARA